MRTARSSPPLAFRCAKQPFDLADEAVDLDRLGIVIVASSLDRLFAVAACMACAVSPITGTLRVASSAFTPRVASHLVHDR